jgi:lysozyme
MIDIAEMLIRHEGLRAIPYLDSVGVWTVGVGHNMSRPLSASAIRHILNDDIRDAANDLHHAFNWFAELDENRQAAMINLCFNLGLRRLQGFVKFLRAMELGDYETAAAELLDSLWASQVGKGRSHEVANLIRGTVTI